MDISSLLNPTASSSRSVQPSHKHNHEKLFADRGSRVSPDPGAPEGFDIWPEPYFIEGDSGKKNLPAWLVYQGHRYRKGNDRGANPQRIRIGEEDAPGELIVRPLLDDRPIDVWLCEICHCYYKVKLSWARHLHLHISGEPEKPYICDICGASNAQQANHRSHMAQHSGEKPYECIVPECGFRSGQASNRNKHELPPTMQYSTISKVAPVQSTHH
ncbi:hypothetical protein DL93DRAFT_1241570 [Clavulina sp. PMI_390]|nr:hypothetical protein DL93DRAFT_1241570 [Clavulina sp. PMI_390]